MGAGKEINIWEAVTSSKPVYGESDVEACRRIFGGQKFKCRGYVCSKEIEWPGLCDECIAKLTSESMTDNERRESRLEAMGVPTGMLHCDWDDWKQIESLDQAALDLNRQVSDLMDWNGRPHLVVISGPPGTGKTHMAISVLKEYVEANTFRTARFWTEFNFIQAIKQSFSGGKDVMHDTLKSVDLLVFDDLGVVRSSDWSAETRAGLLNARIDNRKLTLITTNLGQAEISQTIDERLASRLNGAYVVNTKAAQDFRKPRF